MNQVEQIKINSNHLRGTLSQSLADPITGALAEDDQTIIKFHGSYQQDDRDVRERRAEKKLEKLFSFMIRLRIPGGKITAAQWLGIHEISEANSSNVAKQDLRKPQFFEEFSGRENFCEEVYKDIHDRSKNFSDAKITKKVGDSVSPVKITTRQTVQLHGIIKSKLKPTIAWFNRYNLDSIAACGDVNRNVIATATVAKNPGHDEVYEFSKKISEHLLPNTRAYHEIWLNEEKISKPELEPLYGKTYLPRKFKIAIAIPPHNDVDVFAHDIGLIAIIENEKLTGFNLAVGGGLGATHGNAETFPRLGNLAGFFTKEKTLDAVYQIVAIQRDFGNRIDRKKSRFKYTIEKFGVDWFISEFEKRTEFKLEKAHDFKLTKRGDDYGWDQDYVGLNHFTLFVENGRVFSEKKLALKEIAEKKLGNFRFTNNQNIIISDVKDGDKKLVNEILRQYGVTNDDNLPIRLDAIACVAFNTCPLALAEAQRYLPSLITKIEKILLKFQLEKEPISIRMTGCPNGCGRPYLAEIGLIGKSLGKYNLHLGGNRFGTRLNQLYKEDLDEAQILAELENQFTAYKSKRLANQNFGDFIYEQLSAAA